MLWPKKIYKIDEKPPIATLRLDVHIIAIYIDDLINVGLTFDERVVNVIASIKHLNSLGFIIHPDKSIFLPKREITFLGFDINSWKMKITLADWNRNRSLAGSQLFPMFTQSINFYQFHCYIINSTNVLKRCFIK